MRTTRSQRGRGGRRARWRPMVQVLFFAFVALLSLSRLLAAAGAPLGLASTPSLHAVCPFGGVVSIYQFFATGTLVKKVHDSSVVLMGIGLLLAILFGPVFCGWACPVGSIQEWMGKLGRRILGRRYNRLLPARIDRWLRYLRYAVLAWVLYMTAVTGRLAFEAWDPYWSLFNLWTGEVAITGYVVLGLTVALSLLVQRPFCKYACPYGAFLGLSNLVRAFGVRRNPPTCTSCRACDRACPMGIEVSAAGGRIRNHQCISCLECTSEKACPVPRTVVFGAGKIPPIPVTQPAGRPEAAP